MIRCDDSAVEKLVFDELSLQEALEVRAHVSECPRCHEEHARLLSEQGLFAARRRVLPSEGLPDLDQILARASETKRERFGWARKLLSAPGAWVPVLERVAVVGALALVLVGVARQHRPDSGADSAPTSLTTSSREGASASRPAQTSAPRPACSECRPDVARVVTPTHAETPRATQSEGNDWLLGSGEPLPVSMMTVGTDTRRGAESTCGREQSLMPGTLDRIVSSSSMMCVPDQI